MCSYAIRGIEPGDAEQLADIHVAIWKATYPGLVDRKKLDALQPRDRIEFWTRAIEFREESFERGVHTVCAVDIATSQVVGFATGGPPLDENAPASIQLWSLNILPAHHGLGVGSLLMKAVLREGPAYLWVAAGNARAVSFYRKHKFELDGMERFDSEWSCLEQRMVRTA